MFYSKTAKGFYDPEIHGARTRVIADPAWTRPLVNVTLQSGEQYGDATNDTAEPLTLTGVPDLSASPPLVEVANPDTLIPADAVEIPEADYLALLEGQARGLQIVAAANGYPVLQAPAPWADRLKAFAARIRAARGPIMGVLDGMQATSTTAGLAAFMAGDAAGAQAALARSQAIEALKVALKNATTPGVLAVDESMTDAQLDDVAQAHYRQLAASAPADVRSAFRDVAG